MVNWSIQCLEQMICLFFLLQSFVGAYVWEVKNLALLIVVEKWHSLHNDSQVSLNKLGFIGCWMWNHFETVWFHLLLPLWSVLHFRLDDIAQRDQIVEAFTYLRVILQGSKAEFLQKMPGLFIRFCTACCKITSKECNAFTIAELEL